MDGVGYSWLEKFHKDPEIKKGANPEAARLFAVKISNLIRKGHIVGHVRFYWTPGSQYRPGKGPHLRAIIEIDGKSNRFWFYSWFNNCVWQNTTKQHNSYKKHAIKWKI